jgi:hypothetical protein
VATTLPDAGRLMIPTPSGAVASPAAKPVQVQPLGASVALFEEQLHVAGGLSSQVSFFAVTGPPLSLKMSAPGGQKLPWQSTPGSWFVLHEKVSPLADSVPPENSIP